MDIDHSVAPSAFTSKASAAAPLPAPDNHAIVSGALGLGEGDPKTVAYILATRVDFDRLRQVAGQLAGLLVLAMSGITAITPEHAVLKSAKTAHGQACAELRAVGVPERAKHHHHHLVLALDLIGLALERCAKHLAAYGPGRRDVDEALRPLQSGYAHLQRAAALLAGFEIIAFSQGCCASHPAVAKPTPLSS